MSILLAKSHQRSWILFVALVFASTAAEAHEPESPVEEEDQSDPYLFFQAEGHLSFLSDAPNRSVFASSRGGAIRGGYRWRRWGIFGHIEQNRWRASETQNVLTQGVLNIGGGGDYRFFEDRVRSSITLGTSTLLFDTLLNDVGTTGFFVDLRPGGLRWFPLDWLTLEFQPMSFSLIAPVVTKPVLVHIEYRTAFIVEFQL